MTRRSIPTWALIGLSLLAGAGLGAWGQVTWGDAVERRWRAELRDRRNEERRRRDPEGWQHDSIAMADRQRRPRPEFPREVLRRQTLNHCAITYQIRDTVSARMPLFGIRVRDRRNPTLIVSEAWRFEEPGYPPGSLVTLVLPEMECGQAEISGMSRGMVGAAPALRLPP